MRSPFRKASFPICVLAPDDLISSSSSADASAEIGEGGEGEDRRAKEEGASRPPDTDGATNALVAADRADARRADAAHANRAIAVSL